MDIVPLLADHIESTCPHLYTKVQGTIDGSHLVASPIIWISKIDQNRNSRGYYAKVLVIGDELSLTIFENRFTSLLVRTFDIADPESIPQIIAELIENEHKSSLA